MDRIRILFLIPNLLQGGAERVLINLVNHMDRERYDITVQTMFDTGIYRDKLNTGIRYIGGFPWYFPGNTHVFKLFSPEMLFRLYIRDEYDIVVSYLEGPSARVVAGCPAGKAKLVCWIHVEQLTSSYSTTSFRNNDEADLCYSRYNKIICVSEAVRKDFIKLFPCTSEPIVLYNTVESGVIFEKSHEPVEDVFFSNEEINLISVGTVKSVKGFDRMIPVIKKLRENGFPVHMFVIGSGPDEKRICSKAEAAGISEYFTIVGFRENPYKYVHNSDLYVCSSYREGFSTAVTEALIVGTPVVSTDCSGARELLGENNEYGIVTENNEDGLYDGIKQMLDSYHEYAPKAEERGRMFDTGSTVKAVEEMFEELVKQ